MTVSTVTSKPPQAEGLIYNYVKRRNPRLLLEMFGRDRCRDLERKDHNYDRGTLRSLLVNFQKMRGQENGKPIVHAKNKELSEVADKEMNGHTASQILSGNGPSVATTLKLTPQLLFYYYLHERKRFFFINELFDPDTRKEHAKTVSQMGIEMPPLRRLYANYKRIQLKKKIQRGMEIWKCELCKKDYKTGGVGELLNHVGYHEHLSFSCVVEGCNGLYRPKSYGEHLKLKHVLLVANLNSEQYHRLRQSMRSYYKLAALKRNKYFPPETFIGFDDRKIRSRAHLEDPKCTKCGKLVQAKTTRRTHVAEHLNLRYTCIMDGCEAKMVANNLGSHLVDRHKKRVADLNVEELAAYRRIKKQDVAKMEKCLPTYFPLKENAEEDPYIITP
ncbi:hypothetical protein QR680_011789 [Steinernema hermaphroditum]|uniref:C2H2-type domain-containing protein n=1 Tax=Steinernema hermaphroditum TaxID=289476 RepID=A0AA39HZS3_9BILA|nr:hypothetical protein QR680_011789 [Steinernema hermaphroditum]